MIPSCPQFIILHCKRIILKERALKMDIVPEKKNKKIVPKLIMKGYGPFFVSVKSIAKGDFFSESAIRFSNLQISKSPKKSPKKLS